MELTHIGSYRVEKALGKGAFGIVYQAYQPFLDRHVAIKTLHETAVGGSQGEQQFMREARTIARLRHNNILTVYEFGTLPIENTPITYMVMEYLPGETLYQRLRREHLPLTETITILEKLASAIDYAHERGVVHRDLKPANVIFNENGEPVIVDFGLAKLAALNMGDTSPELTDLYESTVIGTPAYMSPEQIKGEPTGPAADLYALAIMAFEMLTEQYPFDVRNVPNMLMERVQGMHRTLDQVAPEYGTSVSIIFDRALSLDPSDRYANTTTFIRELGDALIPDRRNTHIVTVIDPAQAAMLRAARQTIAGVLWGTLLFAAVIAIAMIAITANGYQAGSPIEFAWDGIFVPVREAADGWREVLSIWSGSPAEQAGIQAGDLIHGDLMLDTHVKDVLYSVNNIPRSDYRTGFEPGIGDVIERVVRRGAEEFTVRYTLEASPYIFLVAALTIPMSFVFLGFAAWLLRRWGAEPGLQVLFPLYLAAALFEATSLLFDISLVMNLITSMLLVTSTVHILCIFPQPLSFIRNRQHYLWLLYVPASFPIVYLVLGSNMVTGASAVIIIGFLFVYFLITLGLLIFKWMWVDWRDFPGLGWMIAALWSLILSSWIAFAIIFFGAIEGRATVHILYIFVVRAALAPIMAPMLTYGYHKIQSVMGASLPPQDKSLGKSIESSGLFPSLQLRAKGDTSQNPAVKPTSDI
jgi:eukaryotic-like serine/threonine-protein kinase